ncbi:hypothetical protein HMPREF0580_0948 [Mobiluncus mulieris ATCC 35239]|uniref:Uncharacterized protein n=1 Tax=Mobiluncus mulieris ATCC 35239 TaxID=871571 RepID=E0QQ21_9ACTO|nr:hypothetical protein HMPREF0580_0948 [Mobiluncus mulieris ATCC 35239]
MSILIGFFRFGGWWVRRVHEVPSGTSAQLARGTGKNSGGENRFTNCA